MTTTRSGRTTKGSNSETNKPDTKRASTSIGTAARKKKRVINPTSQSSSNSLILSHSEEATEPVLVTSESLDEFDRPQFLGYRATNPLGLHEIRTNVARFLSRSDIRNCLLVCEAWWESFAPFLWTHLRPVYRNVLGGTNDYPPHRLMRKYGHLIRSFEYNGHGTVLLSMISIDRLHSNSNTYVEETRFWLKSTEEEAEEESWQYVDEDIEVDGQLDPDETLSDFETRIENKKIERQNDLIRLKDVRAANRRQNEVSRFLNDTTDYRNRNCDQIDTLIFSDRRYSRDRGCHYKCWIKLIQINQAHLRSLEFTFGIKAFDAFRDIFNQIVLLERLTELTLFDNDFDTAKVNPFLEIVCPRLTKLVLSNVRIEHGHFPGGPTTQPSTDCQIPLLANMKSLTLSKVTTRNNAFSLLFLSRCPNLVELTFRPQWGLSLQEFNSVLLGKLTNLTHLSFSAHQTTDAETSSIIKAIKEAQKLELTGCAFGLLSNNALSFQHMLTISHLDLRLCQHLSGFMIQRILGECRYLRAFLADTIRSKDIINNSVYQNWACIGLRELSIDFRGDPKDDKTNLSIYKQLAQLTCLEVLDISRLGNGSQERDPSCLSLSLKSGLGHLRTLIHLNKLVYRGVKVADVGVVELMWMAKAWPFLTLIGGKLKPRKSTQYNPNVHPKEDVALTEDNSSSFSSNNLANISSNNNNTSHSSTSSNPTNSSSTNGVSSIGASTSSHPSTSPNTSGTNTQAAPIPQPLYLPHHRAPASQVPNTPKLQTIPRNLMAIELKRLNLHNRIKVIPHSEDKVPKDQRKKNRYLQGESSDEDPERHRPGQIDPRYRTDVRDWML
ncbi:hypothetical protein BGZ76_001975 [Entomortierella beljakovae]|nr:hypothetical protein BGZ76_001975 [Entomortierella beljakovae]